MNRGLLIAGGAIGAGALIAVAIREREPIREVVQAVKEKVTKIMGGITQQQIDRIARHDIGSRVERYRGAVPWGVGMGIIEHESDFDPTIYNYYVRDANGKMVKDAKGQSILKIAHAAQGAGKFGDGWFEFDPHAVGLMQILDQIRINQGGKYGDVALPKLTDLLDPDKNIHAGLAARDSDTKRILAAVPGANGALLAALIYFAHADGLGKLVGGMKNGKYYDGAFAKLKAAGKPITWENFVALPWGNSGWWSLGNRLSGIAKTAARAAVWELAKAKIMGVPVAVGTEPGEPSLSGPDVATAMIYAIQAAEMERDLTTATQLREELARIQGAAT